MSLGISSISPIGFYSYKVGVRLGQILRLHERESPTYPGTYADLRVLIASLCDTFVRLSNHVNLELTSLSRIVGRGGCKKFLDPLVSDGEGELYARSLIGEFKQTVGSFAGTQHEGTARLRGLFDVGVSITNTFLDKQDNVVWGEIDERDRYLQRAGLELEDLYIEGYDPAWGDRLAFEYDGYGWWGIENGLVRLEADLSGRDDPPDVSSSELAAKQHASHEDVDVGARVVTGAVASPISGGSSKAKKQPSEYAFIAYRLQHGAGIETQQKIADIIYQEKGKRFNQGQISRLLTQVTQWIEAGNVCPPPPKPMRRETSMDPEDIEMGAHREGRSTHQRNKPTDD